MGKEITINATRLPMTVKVLGQDVILEKIKPLPKRRLRIRVVAPSAETKESRRLEIDGDISIRDANGHDPATEIGTMSRSSMYSSQESARGEVYAPLLAKPITVSVPVHRVTDGPVEFRFTKLEPSALPVQKTIRGASVTIEKVYIDDLVSDRRPIGGWVLFTRDKRVQALVIKASLYRPTDSRLNVAPYVENWGDGPRFGMKSSDERFRSWVTQSPYNLLADTDRVSLEVAGQSLQIIGRKIVFEDDPFNSYLSVLHHPTRLERVALNVNCRLACRMAAGRARAAADRKGERMTIYYAFPWKGPLPKELSFRTEMVLPPDPADTAVVTFTNVPAGWQ